MNTLIKTQVNAVLQDYAKPGYEISIASSILTISNVEILAEKFVPTSLPCYVLSCFIKKVHVDLSLSLLKNKPMQTKIEDIVLLIKPKTDQVWTEADEVAAFVREKAQAAAKEWNEDPFQQQLHDFFSMYCAQNQGGYKGQISKMFRKAVNNADLTITNLQVRYEDHAVQAYDRCNAIGCSIDRIESYATNHTFTKEYVDNVTGDIHRVLKAEHIQVYCDPNVPSVVTRNEIDHDSRSSRLSGNEILTRLNALEDAYDESTAKTFQWWDSSESVLMHHYLISPLNSLELKITSHFQDIPSSAVLQSTDLMMMMMRPRKVNVEVACESIAASIDTEQMIMFTSLAQVTEDYTKWQQFHRQQEHLKQIQRNTPKLEKEYDALVEKKMYQVLNFTSQDQARLTQLQTTMPLERLYRLRGHPNPLQSKKQDAPQSSASVAASSGGKQFVEYLFTEEGSLGLEIEVDPIKYGHAGVRVVGCVPDGQADRLGIIPNGLIIYEIGQVNVETHSYEQVLELLQSSARPLKMVFTTVSGQSSTMQQELQNSLISISFTIPSSSLSIVSSSIHREIYRVIGSKMNLEIHLTVAASGNLNALTGKFALHQFQISDRWNPATSFESQCLLSGDAYQVPAVEFAFELPFIAVDTGGHVLHPSVRLHCGKMQMYFVFEHYYRLCNLMDEHCQILKHGVQARVQYAGGQSFQNAVSSFARPSLQTQRMSFRESFLCDELVPGQIALNGIFDETLIECLQAEVAIGSFSLDLLTKSPEKLDSKLETLACLSLAHLNFGLHQTLDLKTCELTLQGFTHWAMRHPGAKHLDFIAGTMHDTPSLSFSEAREKLLCPTQTLDTSPAIQVHAKIHDLPSVFGCQGIEVDAKIQQVEIHAHRALGLFNKLMELAAPLLFYGYLAFNAITKMKTQKIMRSSSSGSTIKLGTREPRPEYYLLKLAAEVANVLLFTGDFDPASSQQKLIANLINATTAFHSNSHGEEQLAVRVGPIYAGMMLAEGPASLAAEDTPVAFHYKRRKENASGYAATYDRVIELHQVAEGGEGLGVDSSNVMKNYAMGQWHELPNATIAALFRQVQNDLAVRLKQYENKINAKCIAFHELAALALSSPSAFSRDEINWETKKCSAGLVNSVAVEIDGQSFPCILSCREMLENLHARFQVAEAYLQVIPGKFDWTLPELHCLASHSMFRDLHLDNFTFSFIEDEHEADMLGPQFASVQRLTLSNCKFHSIEAFCRFLLQFPQLLHLRLDSCSTVGTLTRILSTQPLPLAFDKLQTLYIVDCKDLLSACTIPTLVKSSLALTHLYIENGLTMHSSTETFELASASLTHCTLVNCSGTFLSDEALSYLCAHCPKLEHLNCSWNSKLVHPLVQGSNLRQVTLYRCANLSVAAINQIFATLPALQVCDLTGTRRANLRPSVPYPKPRTGLISKMITNMKDSYNAKQAGYPHEAKELHIQSPSLQELYLDDNTLLADQEVTFLMTRCPSLHTLSISHCTLLVNPMLMSKSLRHLNAANAPSLSTHAIEVLVTNCPAIETVNMQNCKSVDIKRIEQSLSKAVKSDATGKTTAGLQWINQIKCRNHSKCESGVLMNYRSATTASMASSKFQHIQIDIRT